MADDQNTALVTVRKSLTAMLPQFAAVLPKHLTPERLARVALTSIRLNPKLLQCDRNSLFAAVMTSAQLGLEPDGILGQGFLVPFAGKVQFVPGYKGLISLARNSGDVDSIIAQVVYDKDLFEFEWGTNERLVHRPAFGDRGKPIYVYAYARFRQGGWYFDVLTVDDVNKVRDASNGWKSAVKYQRVADSPWTTHWPEMACKTLVRRIAKYLPLSVQKAAALEDSFEGGRVTQIDDAGAVTVDLPDEPTPAPEPPRSAPPPSNGPIIDVPPEDIIPVPDPEPTQAPEPPKTPARKVADKVLAQAGRTRKPEPPPAAPAPPAPAPPAPAEARGPEITTEEFIEALEPEPAKVAEVEAPKPVEQLRIDNDEPMIDDEDLQAMFQMADAKLGGEGQGELWLRKYTQATYKVKPERLPVRHFRATWMAVVDESKRRGNR